MWGWGKNRKIEHPLDKALLHWTEYDPFRVRDLLNGGCLILGRTGSGKTSSSGRQLMQAIVDNRNSGGLILAAKPEDVGDIKAVFEKAGRLNDLIVFSAESGLGFNLLGYLGHEDPRNIVKCLMTIGKAMEREGGNDHKHAFYETLYKRYLENDVIALKAAGEPITADRILSFLMSAATSKAQQENQQWQDNSYHNRMMEQAAANVMTGSPLVQHDFKLSAEFWVREYPLMDGEVRSNGLAGVMNILHTFNQGIVRQMVSSHTNCSPDDILKGKWVVVDFPPSTWGEVGSFICAGWKYLTQMAILKRQATEQDAFCVIWVDEAHQFVSDTDAYFIAQCRSHKGALIYLSQSVSSFYAALKGDGGKAQADALLANFSHVIVHVSDAETAKWASSKLGKRREMMFSGSNSPGKETTLLDQMFGQNQMSMSFSVRYEDVLQTEAFLVGRTGGPDNNLLADAIALKSGEPFSNGMNYLRVVFSQRG